MNILITGTSKGIGYELVKQFAQNTNINIVALSRDIEQLSQLKEYCKKTYQNNIHIYSIDFLSSTFQQDLVNILDKHQIHFNIIINNAGLLINKPFGQYSSSEVHDVFQVNTYAPIFLIQECLKNLKAEDGCHIINVGSMGGFQGSVKFSGLSIYSASKAALANLTECVAEEFKESNLKINCLALGSVQTEMLNKAFPNYKAQLTPVQIAKYIYSFSLEGGEYFNGKIIPISNSTP